MPCNVVDLACATVSLSSVRSPETETLKPEAWEAEDTRHQTPETRQFFNPSPRLVFLEAIGRLHASNRT